ncbi:MAG: HlyD family efflux transporter periplasmic adaptor subunit [Thiolinea sp.]
MDRTPIVEVQSVTPQNYTVNVKTSGIVKARTQSSLVTEVAGKVLEISPNFRPGGYFAKGDLLLKLDDTNYQDAINIAKSNIAANAAALAQLDQEEKNNLTNLQLAEKSLLTVQKNLQLAQQNIGNIKRKDAPIQKNSGLIQQNLILAKKNLALGQRNLALAKKELERTRDLAKRRLIALNQVEAQEQKVLQLEQSVLQQQQNIVQQEQQLTQQDQSLAQQDQNVLQQQQQVLQQEQAVNQQMQTVANLRGQLAIFDSKRKSLQANNELTRTQLLQQERNRERTHIVAPYNGRMLEQRVDVGQYLSPNSVLGVIYATDYVEVDMPLTLEQFSLLDMQESFLGEGNPTQQQPEVIFTLPFGAEQQTWKGKITGTRATLNEQSRQITVVARIDNPFEQQAGQSTSLKIGQYLNASITGKTFNNVYVLPPSAIRQNREVLLMKDNKVNIKPVQVAWSAEQEIVVQTDTPLEPPSVIITPLGQATEGMAVALPGQKKKGGGGRGGKPGETRSAEGKPDSAPEAGGEQGASLRDVPENQVNPALDAAKGENGGKPSGQAGSAPARSRQPAQEK